MSKYILTNETKTLSNGTILHRIQCSKEFNRKDGTKITKGQLGGFVEKTSNLHQTKTCWIGDDACVYGNAIVRDDAYIYENATIEGKCEIIDMAYVYGNAFVSGTVLIGDNSRVYENAQVYGNSFVYGHAQVYGNAKIYGDAWIHDSYVYENAQAFGTVHIAKYSKVYGNSMIGNPNFKKQEVYIIGFKQEPDENILANHFKNSIIMDECSDNRLSQDNYGFINY